MELSIIFFIGFCMYFGLASISYNSKIKSLSYYYLIGIAFAIVSNFLWLYLAKREVDPSKLVILGLIWDTMLTLTYLVVPFLFYGAVLNKVQLVGLVLTVVGLVLVKIA